MTTRVRSVVERWGRGRGESFRGAGVSYGRCLRQEGQVRWVRYVLREVEVVDRGWASEQLIKAAQGGDLESIAAVVHGAHPHVRRFASHLCASPQDAEDAAQEALIVLYRKIA